MQVEADLSKLSEATTTQYLALIEQEERRRVRGSWFQRTCSVCVHGSALCVAVPVPCLRVFAGGDESVDHT